MLCVEILQVQYTDRKWDTGSSCLESCHYRDQ